MTEDLGRLISKIRTSGPSNNIDSQNITCFLTSKKKSKSFIFRNKYKFLQTTDRILESSCYHIDGIICNLCRYNDELKLPHFPEIVFANNELKIQSTKDEKLFLSFNALDAMKMINTSENPEFKVSMSDEWIASREQYLNLKPSSHSFDWSFTTRYKGTIGEGVIVKDTTEEIDIEKLKRRDPIIEFDNFALYEDELHDNGLSKLEIKYRVMDECFLLLQRFFLRVDGVIFRVIDTRIYHDATKNYLLREWTYREQHVRDMNEATLENIKNEEYLATHLPLLDRTMEKLLL
uniref:TIP41-like protein n=1 Tax=Parastrongyloides trichosuri TaxID=131310 RepID=A0A0N4Z5D2_PARTI